MTKAQPKNYVAELATLKPSASQLRKHEGRNSELIKQSLLEHGQVTPIVIDQNNMIRKGNGTFFAAQELKWTHIWVTPYGGAFNAPNSDEDQLRVEKYEVMDNQSSDLSEWNLPALGDRFRGFIEAGVDLESVGWEKWEYDSILQANWSPPKLPDDLEDFSTDNVRAIKLTLDQRKIVEQAIAIVRTESAQEDMPEGRAVELICADYLAGKRGK